METGPLQELSLFSGIEIYVYGLTIYVVCFLLIGVDHLTLLADLWDLESFGWQRFLGSKSKRTPADTFREMSQKQLIELQLLSPLFFLLVQCNLVCMAALQKVVCLEHHVNGRA